MNCDLINTIPRIQDKSYLELGIGNGINFKSVLAHDKVSVDVNGNATFTGTTDEFFSQCSEVFDIVFIDANHDYDFVLRDFNNSVRHCGEWLMIHDLIPPRQYHTLHRFCSDGFRLLYYLLKYTSFEVYPMSTNFGMTYIKMPTSPVFPERSEIMGLSYDDFMVFIRKAELYNDAEIIRKLRHSRNE